VEGGPDTAARHQGRTASAGSPPGGPWGKTAVRGRAGREVFTPYSLDGPRNTSAGGFVVTECENRATPNRNPYGDHSRGRWMDGPVQVLKNAKPRRRPPQTIALLEKKRTGQLLTKT